MGLLDNGDTSDLVDEPQNARRKVVARAACVAACAVERRRLYRPAPKAKAGANAKAQQPATRSV